MGAFDIVVLTLVALTAIGGARQGFVTEALTLVAWLAAVAAVKMGHAPLTEALTATVGTPGGAAVLAFVTLFGLTLLGGRLLAGALGRHSKASVLGPFDRVLGAGFGACKGLLIATLIFLALSWGAAFGRGGEGTGPAWLVEARTYPLLDASARWLVRMAHDWRASGGDALHP